MNENPYLPPTQVEALHPGLGDLSQVETTYPDATNGKRFLTYVIDLGVFYASVFLIIMVGMLSFEEPQELFAIIGPFLDLLVLVLWFVYYCFFESLFGWTLGKLAVGTRVVNREDQRPSLARIFLRTLCRFIPFDQLSFFRSSPGGWHDSLSKTRVVDIRREPLNREDYFSMMGF